MKKTVRDIFLALIVFCMTTVAFSFEELTPDFSSNYSPDLSNTEAGLWMEMSDYEEHLKHSPIRVNDPELNAYLKNVLCKLTTKYCNDIRIYVVRNPYFNASMAPNGMMQIHTGFLIRVRNEAQLASVLGHEIGHYLKRHSIKRFNDVKAKSSFFAFFTLGIAGAVGTGNMNADLGSATIDLTNLLLTGSIFAYSREHEREADKYGIQLLQDAKLDINEAKEIWVNLTEENEAADENINSGSYFYATHPDPGERIGNLEKHARDIENTEKIYATKNSGIYFEKISPILPMAFQDEINLRQFKQTEYIFQELLADNVTPGLIHFYLGELYRLNDDKADDNQILSQYEKSLQHEDHPPRAYRALGLNYYKQRNFTKAKEYFQKYLTSNPNAHDKEMIEFYITTGG